MELEEYLIRDLPDPDSAERFFRQLHERNERQAKKLRDNTALLSDILTLASFSPLLATTMLQHPEYITWLDKRRLESGVRSTDELIESLARFSLTNSSLDQAVVFARFRRRELLRIFLRDVRRLATIAEITEEISNLADAILITALKQARREIDNRFGQPQVTDERGRSTVARMCVIGLGKLGSRELNYSSDIDLLFIYSDEGRTTGRGTRGQVTNREYFIKVAEHVIKLVGAQTGDGGSYRVDLRLRPHGSLGALAWSVNDLARYYANEARPWELQVLVRSRGCAGETELFKQFISDVESLVYPPGRSPESSLSHVRESKLRIDTEHVAKSGFNVKLGSGGIREIEFIAQALQVAYGGSDPWLRAAHTLISLARLADRGYISETELTELSAAYDFLRRTEHILQMENGLQTHTIPKDTEKRKLIGARVEFARGGEFDGDLGLHTSNVNRIFSRVFGSSAGTEPPAGGVADRYVGSRSHLLASIEKSPIKGADVAPVSHVLDRLTEISPHFASVIAANPRLAAKLPDPDLSNDEPNYRDILSRSIAQSGDFGHRISTIRQEWPRLILEIAVLDIFERITIAESKWRQTALAEASIATALTIAVDEMKRQFDVRDLNLNVLALGKLGGAGLDYDSDLDLVMAYDDERPLIGGLTSGEIYSRTVELMTTALSALTRDGKLYRVDLRLRPFGSKGLTATSMPAFIEYLRDTASVWELLAFVKLRAVGGDPERTEDAERRLRAAIYQRASTIPHDELRGEAIRVRSALEQKRGSPARSREVDIKYGGGGMLDVYFAMRYLQLRDALIDDSSGRSTLSVLRRLSMEGSLSSGDAEELIAGYRFLSELDHAMRLTIGRTTRVPLSNEHALTIVARRMKLSSPASLTEELTLHRLAIRETYDRVMGNNG